MFDRRSFIGLAAPALIAAMRQARADASRPVNTLGSPDGLAIRG